MTSKENELRRSLASESLNVKWIEDQEKNLNRLLQPCSFCREPIAVAKKDDVICDFCLCPELLCADDGQKGLIGFITEEYIVEGKNIFLKDLEPYSYNLVRNTLLDIASTGRISKKNTEKIELYPLKELTKLF